jgi:hypothetical protein
MLRSSSRRTKPFIAFDIATTIEDAGGMVVGPVATVKEALALLEIHPVAAVILDVNLGDRDISPVAELLLARGVQFTASGFSAASDGGAGELITYSPAISSPPIAAPQNTNGKKRPDAEAMRIEVSARRNGAEDRKHPGADLA